MAARARGDDLVATAPAAQRWLLIECRDAWPREALSVLGDLAAEIVKRCAELHCRPALIRRYGRVDRERPQRWAMVDTRPGHESTRWGELRSYHHLFDVLAGDDPGKACDEPLYLVCTHGRHDTCCAVYGRPVAAALAAMHPDRTWECSHVGGDRFAPNVVLLPHGLFYGQVPVARALELVQRYDEGLLVPRYLRGRGSLVQPVQAAQHYARAVGASYAVDGLRPLDVQELARDRWRVLLEDDGQQVTVEVAARPVTIDAALTCAAVRPGRIRQFELLEVR
jgi:hypothetical protein